MTVATTSFAATHTAEADIDYSGLINQKIGGRDRAIFHLDVGGGTFVVQHFNFVYGSSNSNAGGVAWFYIYGESAAVNGVSGACHANNVCVSKLDRGDAISARPIVPDGGTLAFDSYFNF